MSFGKAKPQVPGALDVSGQASLLAGSDEFLRMWRRPGGDVTCFIDPARLNADPMALGIALMDCVRHGAIAWSRATGVPEAQCLERILTGFDAERGSPTDTPRPMSHDGDLH